MDCIAIVFAVYWQRIDIVLVLSW